MCSLVVSLVCRLGVGGCGMKVVGLPSTRIGIRVSFVSFRLGLFHLGGSWKMFVHEHGRFHRQFLRVDEMF